MNERRKWGRHEWISIGTLLTLAGWIWAMSAKNEQLQRVLVTVDDKDTGIIRLNIRVTSLEDEHHEEMSLLKSIADAVGARKR